MQHIFHVCSRNISFAIAAIFLVVGCAPSTLTVDTTDEAEMTYDGLYPVKGGSADAAWARPGVNISQYSKIKLQGVGIEYRPGGDTGKTYNLRRRADHYEIPDTQKAKLEELLREAFKEELGNSEHFTIVSESGPDVLLISAGLYDVVSFVPPEATGRTDIYLSSVGEATLVLEIRDSASGAILARAVDRRAAEQSFGLQESNRVLNRSEVRRLAKTWARRLRERLDTYASAEK